MRKEFHPSSRPLNLNPSSLRQKSLNKCHSLDKERIFNYFMNRFNENARFSLEENQSKRKYSCPTKKERYNYCCMTGHTDNNFQEKAREMPTSMSEWI